MSKLITDELINERLEAKGFGEKQQEDQNLAREAVLNYYGVELTSEYGSNASFSIYEESTADGYSVWIATHDINQINIGEAVYYYDSDLGDALTEAIKYSNGDFEYPETFYVEDECARYVDEAIDQLFAYLSEKFEKEVISELLEEGYNHKIATPINALQYIEMISQDYQFDKDNEHYYGFINITVDNDYKWLNYATQVIKDRDRHEIIANHYGLTISGAVEGELIFNELKDEN